MTTVETTLLEAAEAIAAGDNAENIVEFVVRGVFAPDANEPAAVSENVCVSVTMLVLAAMRAQHAVESGERVPP